MKNGVYKFIVHNYSGSTTKGFRAEIEFDGQIYSFNYDMSTRSGQRTEVAEVTLKDGIFTIVEKISSSMSSKNIWNLKTNNFRTSISCNVFAQLLG